MDELGYLYIYGRIASAQRWKVGSDVVYSAGIETVLRSHPKISACMVCHDYLKNPHSINAFLIKKGLGTKVPILFTISSHFGQPSLRIHPLFTYEL